MKKICIIGHFGDGKNLLNGQTIKTKIIFDELSRYYGKNEILKIDTYGGKKNFLKAPFQVLTALKNSKNVIIFPAQNGLRIYAPLLFVIKHFFKKRKLHYVVIGGWLSEMLAKKRILAKILKQFNALYVETDMMKKLLEKLGFSNVFVMQNCKRLKILSENELIYCQNMPYRLCTFSRVMREKGIEDAINAIVTVNESLGSVAFTLDIYGQIEDGQIEWFDNLKKSFPDYVCYRGVIPYYESVNVLKNYFALLFPTYYEGEGFAGTVIDSFFAGVPVIASDWKYNKEIINKKVGYIFETRNNDRLIEILKAIVKNPKMILSKKIPCLREASKYRPEKAIHILLKQL